MDKRVYKALSKDDFLTIIRYFNLSNTEDDDVLFNLYIETVALLTLHQQTFTNIPFINLDHQRLILQLLHDHNYRLAGMNTEQKKRALSDELFHNKLINVIVDKYGSAAFFRYDSGTYLTQFSMEISTINVYLNFIMLKLPHIPRKNRAKELYAELLGSAFSYVQTITELLVRGFEKEALATWRSLHELQATLLLVKDEEVLNLYNKHILYALAFNKLISEEESDRIFVEIKAKMRELNLKSKDTKRFIEYGWLTSINEYQVNINKFNFLDGVQALAGLGDKRQVYKIASEVTHSAPITLFTRRPYFLSLVLNNLYDSFLTIEALFAEFYIENADKKETKFYEITRAIYLDDIKLVKSRLPQK